MNPMTDSAQKHIGVVIVAAGRGARMGGEKPKQYQPLMGHTVLSHTLRAFLTHPRVEHICVVIHPDDQGLFDSVPETLAANVSHTFGGATRDVSVLAGLTALPDSLAYVLIHDAARPLVGHQTITDVSDALETHDGAAPALAVTDALWQGDGNAVLSLQPRDGLFRAQTPQGFHLTALLAAHHAHPGNASDDVEVGLAAGLNIAIVPGDETNLKLTNPDDFARATRILKETIMDIRTGNGFDVHRFGPGDHVMLCGVQIPHTRGLQGHSDADVGMHAATDAIYGALGMGDIGQHFPPSDPQWKGAASHIFLTHAADLARENGFTLTHIDITLICEHPKIGPHAADMKGMMAGYLNIDPSRISVKATTSERLGFTGREEGIAAIATATLVAT